MKKVQKKDKIIPDDDVKDVLIYARVSSKRQELEGSGLHSQEARCREFVKANDWKIEKVFHDTYTGGGDFMARKAMREVIKYIDERPHKRFIVLFDDLKRFARDTEFHLKLRTVLKAREVIPKCLNYNFDDSAEGMFVETVLAASNQLERQQNARQVSQKMQACFLDGYLPFPAPRGYTKKKVGGHRHKLCVPNEYAPIIKEAIEGFLHLKYPQKIDVARFLQSKGVLSAKQGAEKAIEASTKILRDPFFAGDLQYLKWDIVRKKGEHEAIISRDVYEKVQKRLESKSTTFTRQDVREDFELRGLVNCNCCGTKYTGAPSKSKTGKKHPYYKCRDKKCVLYGKSIPADTLHTDFYKELKTIHATDDVICLAVSIFEDVWKEELQKRHKSQEDLLRCKTETEENITKLSTHILKTESMTVQKQFEKQIENYAIELEEIESQLLGESNYSVPYRTSMEEVLGVLKSPYDVWVNYSVEQKQRFFSFIFEDNLSYSKKEGYRTPNYALPIRIFQQIKGAEPVEVEVEGVEPSCQKFL